jgi:hypothetical protein
MGESSRRGDLWTANDAINHNRVAAALRTKGYSFVAFANGIDVTEARQADVFVDVAHRPLVDGKFFQTAVDLTALRGLPLWRTGEERVVELHRERVLHTLATAPTLADSAAPVFAFVHVVCPHWPWVFDADGNVPSATGTEWAKRSYADQVRYLNGRILGLVDDVLARSKRPVVLVLQGDHGPGEPPHRVGDQTVVSPQRRRILNAYLFPDRRYERLYDKITPVNTFRVILSQYLGFDVPLVPDRRSD